MKLENNIKREITLKEIYREMGISDEAIEKIKDLFLKMCEEVKRFSDEFIKIFKRVCIKNKEKIVKYKKYQKRVRNRNKLYIKRKQKYGKGKKNGKRKSKRNDN